jgi:hypothetical protein
MNFYDIVGFTADTVADFYWFPRMVWGSLCRAQGAASQCAAPDLGIFDFLIFATILVTFRRSIRYISLESLDLPTKLFFYSASDSPGEVRSLPQDLDFAWSLLARGSPHQTISDLDCPWWLSVVSWGETTVKRLNWGRTEAVLQRQKRGKYPAVTLHRSSLAWPWVQHWKQLDGCSYSMPWTLEVATQDTSR